jgi:hypothetical protein
MVLIHKKKHNHLSSPQESRTTRASCGAFPTPSKAAWPGALSHRTRPETPLISSAQMLMESKVSPAAGKGVGAISEGARLIGQVMLHPGSIKNRVMSMDIALGTRWYGQGVGIERDAARVPRFSPSTNSTHAVSALI